MDIVLKVGGIGLFVNVLNSILNRIGKGEWSAFITLAGVLVVLGTVVTEVFALFNTVRVMFMI